MVDYETMTIEELEQANLALSESREKILQEQLTLNNVLERKVAEKTAAEALETMSDLEKAVLADALK